jgi:hypothetical protein
VIDILGDAGAGGANLDYQVAGFANYQFKPKISLQAGWRYLTVHYQGNDQFLFNASMSGMFNASMSGMVFGATYKFR